MEADSLQLNSHILINPENTNNNTATPSYTIVKYQNKQYRVLIKEYNQNIKTMGFWCLVWMLITICVATVMIVGVHNFDKLAFFIVLALSGLILQAFSILNRKDLLNFFKWSAANTFFSTLLLLILIIINQNVLFVCSAFFGIVQLAISFMFSHQKGKILVEFIILGQLTLFALQADGIINMKSVELMIPITIIAIFIMMAVLFISLYTFVLSVYYQDTYAKKKNSIFFILLLLLSYQGLILIPICTTLFNLNLLIACVPSMIFSSTNSMFLWIYSEQLSLLFCLFKEQVVQAQKSIQINVQQMAKKNSILYRFSQNWFGYELKESFEAFSDRKLPQCIVCTEFKASVVWMPCGHLSVCTPCCKNMLEHGLMSCVLCKQKATEIVRLSDKDKTEMKLDRQMGLSNEKQENIQYQILDQYQVTIAA